MAALKHSRQRDSILAYLDASKEHPTADMIYTAMRKEDPKISLGTVYRNLSTLESIGRIQKISVEGQPDRFDGCAEPHYHFVCQECGRVLDLPVEDLGAINETAQENFSGTIERHVCHFYGTCESCNG